MSGLRSAAVVDFESFPITSAPDHPPAPVGVALDVPGKKPKYLAWAHPLGGNNCTWEAARAELAEIWDSDRDVEFHNARFDHGIAVKHMNLAPLPWKRVHDTMPALFLDNPRAPSFSLKPSAERLFGQAPEERNAVEDWLLEHQPVPGIKLSLSKDSDYYVGAFIAYAPVSLVGPYAVGDVTRTRKIGNKVIPDIIKRGMGKAYDRERRLIPIVSDLEAQGVRVDVKRLATDVALYTSTLDSINQWLCQRLKSPSDTNWDSGPELVEALLRGKAAEPGMLGFTKTGKVQTNKDALGRGVTDPVVRAMLEYRAKLCTYLRTFMRPWLKQASQTGGLIFTTWHSTRTDENGARTGRFSSTPNHQNLGKEAEALFYHLGVLAAQLAKADGHADTAERLAREAQSLPRCPIQLPPLPFVRTYIVPFDGDDVLADRDYSQQELRILGHYEGAVLAKAYLDNPWLDMHALAQKLINELLGTDLPRKLIKNLAFGIIYGMGIGKMAAKNKCTVALAKQALDAYRSVLPGLKILNAEMKRRAKAGEPIHTWGGREYYCEPPRLIDGQMRSFDYRLLNILIQGSAADCTKEALIRYYEAKPKNHRVFTIPHDELLVSLPRRELKTGMEILRAEMESIEFSVPMLSEGKWSAENWGRLKPYDKAGKVVVNQSKKAA
jgi:DNA polymerase I-like protein with 3'-5' exonuclease and polymerase domains